MILVTGASGFIGQHVCAALIAQGVPVRALTRSQEQRVDGAQVAVAADITDRVALRSALRGVDFVVHAAGHAHVLGRGTARLDEYHRINVEGTAVLLQEAVQAGVRGFVLFSSVKAVGEATRPGERWSESVIPAPVDAYGASKLAAERLVREAAQTHGLWAAVLRLPLVYGPGMRANMLRLFQLVDRRLPLPLGCIRNRRSLIFAGNVAVAVQHVLDGPEGHSDVFFVSDGRDLSTPELIGQIGRALRRPPFLLPVPRALLETAGRAGDVLARVVPFPLTSARVNRLLGSLAVDISHIERAAGYRPRFSVEEGMASTAAWFRRRESGAA